LCRRRVNKPERAFLVEDTQHLLFERSEVHGDGEVAVHIVDVLVKA